MKTLFETNFTKGFTLGIAVDKEKLQIAIFGFMIQMNFEVITNNLNKFRECLREN